MPGFKDIYQDAEVAALANYVLAHFGSKEGQVTAEQVARRRAD
jgi:mono/diheme cytochrome c family protein